MAKHKLLLVNPKPEESWWDLVKLPPLWSVTLGSVVPDNWDVEIIDENVQTLNPGKEKADLVGLTATTSVAPNTYRIATDFRGRGIPVVMGGIHATTCPDEALNYVDSVVIGRAEDSFPSLLRDFENGNMKKKYFSRPTYLKDTTPIRHDLLDYSRYTLALVETSKGCPYECDFCSAYLVSGKVPDYKDSDIVIDELERIQKNEIMFVDDNIYGKSRRAREHVKGLFTKLKGMNIRWAGQATPDACEDEEFLKLASESGCKNLLVGVETLNKSIYVGHKNKPKNMKAAIKKAHDYGITITGTFIFGWDSDDKTVFPEAVDSVFDWELDGNRFEILTPLPCTEVYRRYDGENRIFRKNYPEDWGLYNLRHAVFRPAHMTPEELETGTLEALDKTSHLTRCAWRAWKSLINTRSIYASYGIFLLNCSVGRSIKKELNKYYV